MVFFADPLDKRGISAYTITYVAYGSRIERYHRIEARKGVLRNDDSCFLLWRFAFPLRGVSYADPHTVFSVYR